MGKSLKTENITQIQENPHFLNQVQFNLEKIIIFFLGAATGEMETAIETAKKFQFYAST